MGRRAPSVGGLGHGWLFLGLHSGDLLISQRVVFLTSHPIQYQAPLFRRLAQSPEIDFTVLFCMLPNEEQQGAGFGVRFQWDLPLREGYESRVLKNQSRRPSVTEFAGCDTPDLAATLKELDAQTLIVNGWVVKSCLQGLWAARRLNIPCIVRGEANLLRRRAWWKLQLQRQLVRRYDAYLYIGEANRRFYEFHGVRPERLFPARYCIENERFAQVATDARARWRQKWNISEDAVCVLFSGKLEAKKHPVELLHAFQRAAERQPRLHLVVAGDGPLRAECEHIVQEAKSPVTFAGFINQSQIPELYAASDLLVLPSDAGETWGLVVNEAMAAGRPAIVSDLVGCSHDLIQQGQTGWSFRFGDWNQLEQLLANAAVDPVRLQALGHAAQRQVDAYSPDAAVDGILQAVRFVTTSRRTSPAAVRIA